MATESTNTQADRSCLTGKPDETFEITKAVGFEAAHYMPGYPDGHPYRNVHGHSFRLEATIAGPLPAGADWMQDFSQLEKHLQETAAKLDHCLLNDIDGIESPTLEHLCRWVANDLRGHLPGLKRVALSRPSLGERCELVLNQRPPD